MATVSHNIIANFAGRAWTMLMGIAFVPLYLRILGIEAYGLIGFFATLQCVLGIMDLGLSLTLNRELARSCSRTDDSFRIASLLRTMEILYWLLSVAGGAVVFILAPWITRNWVNTVNLSHDEVTNAIRMMGILIALQAPLALYQGGLIGLQRQVRINLILAVAATIRGAGAVIVLWLLSPTVVAYFAWQVIVAGLATGFFAWTLWRFVSDGIHTARFEPALLRDLWKFALAVSANAIVGLSLTQLDKLILSKLITLEQFGYYALAGLVASALWAIILPINTALYPRFVQLYEQRNTIALATFYHKACQFMAVALLPIALILTLFSYEVLVLWTGDVVTARGSYLLVALLAFGTTVYGLISVAGYLQSAAGWPTLILYTNIALAIVLVPTLLVVVPRFGALGAALVWVVMNCLYLVITIPIMHGRLLRGELARWCYADIFVPVLSVAAVGLASRVLMPTGWLHIGQIVYLICVWISATAVVTLVAPAVRFGFAEFTLGLFGKAMAARRTSTPG